MLRTFYIVVCCAALSASALAANDTTVVEIGTAPGSVIVNKADGKWGVGTELCLFKVGGQSSCGKVTQELPNGSELILADPTYSAAVGDRVAPPGSELATPEETADAQSLELEDVQDEVSTLSDPAPEGDQPREKAQIDSVESEDQFKNHSEEEKRRVALIRYHRGLISVAYRDPDSGETVASLTRATRSWMLSGGILSFGENSGNSVSASFHLEYAMNKHYSLGVWVAPQSFGIGDMRFSLLSIGGVVNYYPIDTFEGVTGSVAVALGPASGSNTSGATYTGGLSWNVMITAGWRWKLAADFTVSAQFGLEYVGVSGGAFGSTSNASTYSAIYPLGYLTIGFSFL